MNARHGRLLALAAALCAVRARADLAPLGYPGSTWGNLTRDFTGQEGSGAMGHVRQGVDWFRVPGDVVFDTFGEYDWRFRSQNRPFYNAEGPAAGAEFTWKGVDVGADFAWQHYPELHQDQRAFALFADWYRRVDLAALAPTGSAWGKLPLPFSTWGRVSHDLDEVEGDGTLGWVQQGVDVLSLPGGAVLEPYASYHWRVRSKDNAYYDAYGPTVGAEVLTSHWQLGLEYAWSRLPYLDKTTRGLNAYISWYYSWDLKKR